jgi:hypothetical protein
MVSTKKAKDQHSSGEQKQGADLTAALMLTRLLWLAWWNRQRHLCLLWILIDEIVDAQFEVRAVELLG